MADSERKAVPRGLEARRTDEREARGGGADAAVDAPAQPLTVGGILAQARVAQDLTIEQLAAELRIEAPQLAALEQDRFERIGVPVFVKGYIKQYGMRLGLDTSDLLAAYYKQGKLEDIDIRPSRSIKLRDEQRIRGWVVALLVLLAIVVGLAVWWLEGAELSAILAPAPPAERSPPAPAPAAAAAVRGAAAASADGADVLGRVQVDAPPAAEPPAATAAGASSEDPAADAARVPPDAAPASLRPLERAVDVEVAFDEDSWTEITDARGERLFYGMGSAGRRATLRGEPPFAVVLGNVDGVRITVRGAAYDIPRPKQGNFARFSLAVDEE
jgi:cytoskeleton protein RodZ